MRLFVSVDLSPAAREALVAAVGRLDLTPARLVSPERWHITLAFLGEVVPDRLPALGGRLAGVAEAAVPLQLRLSGSGVFPARGRPSVLWVGLTGDVDGLRRLAGAVARSVRAAGVRLERRKFAPHVTIARYRSAPAGAASAPLAELAGHSGPRFRVEQLHLMRSHLGPRPRHELVEAWQLGGQRGGDG